MRSSCVRFMRKLLRVSHSRLSRWRHSGLSKTGKRVLLRELNLAGRQGFEPRYRGPESGSRVSVRFDRLRFPRFLATTRRFGPVRLARLPCSLSHPVSNRCLQSRLSRFRNHRTDAFLLRLGTARARPRRLTRSDTAYSAPAIHDAGAVRGFRSCWPER